MHSKIDIAVCKLVGQNTCLNRSLRLIFCYKSKFIKLHREFLHIEQLLNLKIRPVQELISI